jgi:aminoglycoside 6'-N-acetyltransferase
MIALRLATHTDNPLLDAWDAEPVIAASDPIDDGDWAQTLAEVGLENLMAELDRRPIGFIQIIDLGRDAARSWGPSQPGFMAIDIWIGDADMRGHGHGRAMMALAINQCSSDSAIHTILIDPVVAKTDAIAFCAEMGFSPRETRRFGDDECLIMRIEHSAKEAATAS